MDTVVAPCGHSGHVRALVAARGCRVEIQTVHRLRARCVFNGIKEGPGNLLAVLNAPQSFPVALCISLKCTFHTRTVPDPKGGINGAIKHTPRYTIVSHEMPREQV